MKFFLSALVVLLVCTGKYAAANQPDLHLARSVVKVVARSADGNVQGGWNADYTKGRKPKMNYVMNAEFEGNIDPTVMFFDENGDDPTKLFIIAKGKIRILATNYDNGKIQPSVQDIWISGWVGKDQRAKGEMLLIMDKELYQTFNWKGSPPIQSQKRLF